MQKYIINKMHRLKNTKLRYRSYFLMYTIVFIVVAFFVFSWYFLTGRTFIWQEDGWDQHYKALIYYAKYLRSILSNIFFQHRLVIPAWDFSIGEGSDILQTLHYYVIGDPFTALSVLVPVRFMYVYYNAMILLRLYLAGTAFSCLCFYTGKTSRYAVMVGSMTYVFCYWATYNAARHPYFLNPMVYLPMLILGIEKIFRKERPYLFIMAVFISAVSNFYYFYVLVLVTVVYVVIRCFVSYRSNIKTIFQMLVRIGAASILGVILAAVVLLPVLYAVLSDTRNTIKNEFHLFYPLFYYSKLPSVFLTPSDIYWLCIGLSAPALPAVFLMFRRRREYGILKLLFIASIVVISIPALGQVLNTFSYRSNKWCWAFALLSSYILTAMWPSLMELEIKDKMALWCCTVVYSIVCLMLEYSRTTSTFAALFFVFIFLFIIFSTKEELFAYKWKQYLAFFVVIASIVNNGFWQNSSGAGQYASESKEVRQVTKELRANEAAVAAAELVASDNNGFHRYSGRSLTRNAGVLVGASSTQYYWSLSNPYINYFRKATEQRENSNFNYEGYDDRTALITLASVLYYMVPARDSAPVPYGFTYVDTVNVKEAITEEALSALKSELQVEELTEDQIKIVENATKSEYKIYRNDNALPLAYTYDSYISTDTWNLLSAVEKQEALLSTAVIDDYGVASGQANLNFTCKDIDYKLSCNGNSVSLQDNTFVVTSPNATVTLNFEGIPDSETYFSIEGLYYEGVPEYDLYFGGEDVDPLNLYNEVNYSRLNYSKRESMRKNKLFWIAPTSVNLTLKSSTGVSKIVSCHTEDFSWYAGRHNFTANLDYSEDAATSITITFPNVGIYTFDSISITCQPMNHYVEQVNALKENTLENVEINTNTVTGTISLQSPKMLCLAIPYSDGWSAYVDGRETELYRANIMYMALALESGEHTVELVYKTPLLKEGIYISMLAVVILVVFIFLSERNRINKKEEVKV